MAKAMKGASAMRRDQALLAFELSLESVEELLLLQEELDGPLQERDGVQVHWSEPTLIQVSLKTLGALEPALWLRVCDLVEHVASSLVPFKVGLGPVQAHPSAHQARLLLARLEMGSELAEGLHKVLEEYLERIGIPKDPRPFWPGAILGHVAVHSGPPLDASAMLTAAALDAPSMGETFVRDLVLYRGQLKRGKPQWQVYRRFALGKRVE